MERPRRKQSVSIQKTASKQGQADTLEGTPVKAREGDKAMPPPVQKDETKGTGTSILGLRQRGQAVPNQEPVAAAGVPVKDYETEEARALGLKEQEDLSVRIQILEDDLRLLEIELSEVEKMDASVGEKEAILGKIGEVRGLLAKYRSLRASVRP